MAAKKNTIKKTVFISSTFLDLKEERKKVWECLEKFDVTVKGMEQFGAQKSTPLETCLAEVEQSDIFVGIIGMRYGSEELNSGKSYSQLEYEKALEQDKEILIYLIDEENSAITPNLIQYDKIQKLNNFKAILKDKHTIDNFSNSQDLVTKLQRKFNELLTPKVTKLTEDEYDNTNQIMNLFFLVPAAYSGREIKLKIKFDDRPQPVSKEICKNFNFRFGKTIMTKIEVKHPSFEFENFRHIFIEYEHFDKFIQLDKRKNYEIFAKVLFKDEKVATLTTDFKDKYERVRNDQYLFNNKHLYNNNLYVNTAAYANLNSIFYDEYSDVLKEGDGQIALNLTDIIK